MLETDYDQNEALTAAVNKTAEVLKVKKFTDRENIKTYADKIREETYKKLQSSVEAELNALGEKPELPANASQQDKEAHQKRLSEYEAKQQEIFANERALREIIDDSAVKAYEALTKAFDEKEKLRKKREALIMAQLGLPQGTVMSDHMEEDAQASLPVAPRSAPAERLSTPASPIAASYEKLFSNGAAPYQPGFEKGSTSPSGTFKAEVENSYTDAAKFNIWNLYHYFGKNFDAQKWVVPITFLGKPLRNGVNIMAVPFLKAAEEEIQSKGVDYKPVGREIGGLDNRDMNIMSGQPSGIPSFHKFGLAFDIDASLNGPKSGRGTIPDEVVMALVHAGFTWGGAGKVSAENDWLGNDPMHFQLRYDPRDEVGQSIINRSPAAKAAWEEIKGKIPAYAS